MAELKQVKLNSEVKAELDSLMLLSFEPNSQIFDHR